MKDSEPAFPTSALHRFGEGTVNGFDSGMSLRDWFAGQVLIGILAAYGGHLTQVAKKVETRQEQMVAGFAYLYADAMLKEREK